MSNTSNAPGWRIWAVDNVVYGPVELPVLVGWVQEERVTAETWIYAEEKGRWTKAGDVEELRIIFQKREARANAAAAATPVGPLVAGLKPGMMRRVKILGGMNDQQLGRFAQIVEVVALRQFQEVVRQGEHGDAMYMILEGEVRVRQIIGGKETTIATLGPGEFFGEISLFDQGPRSADVVANTDGTLLKISVAVFEDLAKKEPDLATPFMLAVARTLTARIRADNKRYRDSLSFARAAGVR
jgi:CRP/FNR family cyclic AMP-dependent transcriptional regulator